MRSLYNSLVLMPCTDCLFNARAINLGRLNEVWNKSTVYIARSRMTDKVVFFVSSGDLGDKYKVGTTHRVHHDQTHADRGHYEIINVVNMLNGEVDSTANTEYLANKAPVWVFK
jgi:hypothetical protein